MRGCSCTSISTILWNNRGQWTVYLKGYFWISPVSVLRHFHRGLLPPPSNPTHWVRIEPGRRFDAHCVWSQDFNSFYRNAINQLELVNKAKWIGHWAGASNTNTNCVFYFWILPVALTDEVTRTLKKWARSVIGKHRVVTKISSCRVNTTSRRGIKRLGISFGSIFLVFSNKSSRGPLY